MRIDSRDARNSGTNTRSESGDLSGDLGSHLPERIKMKVVISTLCVAVMMLNPCSAEQKYHFEQPYFGKPLNPVSFDSLIYCMDVWEVNGGYDQNLVGKESFNRQYVLIDVLNVLNKPTMWKNDVHGNTADVILTDSRRLPFQIIDTKVWSVVWKTEKDLVLMRTGDPQWCISTITIDAENGTFIRVFSGRVTGTNHVNVDWGNCGN